MLKLKTFAVASLLLFLPSFVGYCDNELTATDKTKVIIGVVVFPPFTLKNEQGEGCHGPYITHILDVFSKSRYSIHVICAPAARIYRLVQSGEIDMTINVNSTQELIDHVDFFERPFAHLQLSLVRYNNAVHKTVAAIRAFDYEGYRSILQKQGFEFVDVPTALDAVNVFLRKRTDYLLTYIGPFDYLMKEMGTELENDITRSTIANIPTFFAVAHASRYRDGIMQWLQNASLALPRNTSFVGETYSTETRY